MQLNTADVLNETALILRKEHPAYDSIGDKIENAESFLHKIARDFPEDAKAIATDIRTNLGAASEVCGLSPDRCAWVSNRLCYEGSPIEQYYRDRANSGQAALTAHR